MIHLRQLWADGVPAAEADTVDIPALEFCDRVNWMLPDMTASTVVLSDGLTIAAESTIRSMVDHCAAWSSATVARDDSHQACKLIVISRVMLTEVGGLNPKLRAFYWLDDLARRVPAVSYKFVVLRDLDAIRQQVMLEYAVEAVQDLGQYEAPL